MPTPPALSPKQQDFSELLLYVLQTLSRTAMERGYSLISADINSLIYRSETYFRSKDALARQRATRATEEQPAG
jgi:hypothetical protein